MMVIPLHGVDRPPHISEKASIAINERLVMKTELNLQEESKFVASRGEEPEKCGWQEIDQNDGDNDARVDKGGLSGKYGVWAGGPYCWGRTEGLRDVQRRVTERAGQAALQHFFSRLRKF
ncbi:hypothetical protein EV421DRAFT_2022548 [Armillaria borealis]|uniref:Uncharacterized protein n=1 Tax=Armillaria borealis TaxID=47425 RepID=A0AA39MJ74_9AGAR|nr:hypothetical protein EV421DRAFT_2022548 [Armillaria borealis]